MCTATSSPPPVTRLLGAVAQLHLTRTLRCTPRPRYDGQVLRSYVSATGDAREAQLMAGPQADCVAGAARWAQATGELVAVVANTAEPPRADGAVPPAT